MAELVNKWTMYKSERQVKFIVDIDLTLALTFLVGVVKKVN